MNLHSSNSAILNISLVLKFRDSMMGLYFSLKQSTSVIFLLRPTWRMPKASTPLWFLVLNWVDTRYCPDVLQDPTFYRSIVGALQYVTTTRPEICFSVNKAYQFLSQPLESHWKAVKRILRYLHDTSGQGLLLQPAVTPLTLTAFSDADWGSDPDDRKSTSGSLIYLGPNLVSWWFKKQTLVARSSSEAKYRNLANTVSEVL